MDENPPVATFSIIKETMPNTNESNKLTEMIKEHQFSPTVRQVFAGSGSLLSSITAGLVVGYSAILLPQLRDSKEFNFNSENESWIASMAALPMAPGCIIGGVAMQIYGRRSLNILVGIPFFAGWMLLYFSSSLTSFLSGRFLQGISLGISGPLNSVFIGETTEPKLRGILLASVTLGYAFGISVSHALGTFYSWRTTAVLCSSVTVMSSLIFLFVPETPSYLLSKGRLEAANKSFCWLRGHGKEAAEEFQSMVKSQNIQKDQATESIFSVIRKPEFYKPLAILLGIFFVLQFVGVNAIIFYTVTIMKGTTIGDSVDEYIAMLMIDGVRFGIGIVACILIKHIKRRPLCLLSGFGVGICLLALSAFLYISTEYAQLHDISCVPLILLIGYICFAGLGLAPLPWCLMGELFPLRYRGIGTGIASAVNFMYFFIVVKMAPFMFMWLKVEGTFIIYGITAIIGTLILALYMPETMDKTLQEIEDEFSNKSSQNATENKC